MEIKDMKEALIKFKAVKAKLFLKEAKSMHYEVIEKNIDNYNAGLALGLNSIEATILVNRTSDVKNYNKFISPRFKDIMDYSLLKDIDIATDVIQEHMDKNGHIILLTDYDCDGATSCSIAYLFLTQVLKYKNVSYILNERIQGNGINTTLVAALLKEKEKYNNILTITFDHGSSSGDNIKIIKESGINIIVTDHHELSKNNAPTIYDAFINPQRPDCKYDKAISGCTVAYLLIRYLGDRFKIDPQSELMMFILSITSLSVISDSMRLNSITNRAIVKTGLKYINKYTNDSWIRLINGANMELADYKTFGWSIAPMINSASRMGDASAAPLPFILNEDRDIRDAVSTLQNMNEDRKKLQNELYLKLKDRFLINRESICTVVDVVDKGLGIQGILSSMFSNEEQKPSVIFYRDSASGTLQGSGRSARNVNLLGVLREIEKDNKEYVLGCGGHEKAAGITIKEEFLEEFKKLFESGVQKYLNFDHETTDLTIRHKVDMELESLSYEVLKSVNLLSPYGQEWPEPLFATVFKVDNFGIYSRPNKSDTYNLTLSDKNNVKYIASYYTNGKEDFTITKEMYVDIVYSVKYNPTFDKNIGLNIVDLHPSAKVVTLL